MRKQSPIRSEAKHWTAARAALLAREPNLITIMNHSRKLLAILPLALALAACSTTETSVGPEAEAANVVIEKGMPVADLVAAIGEPDAVRQVDPPREGFAIWTYEKTQENVTLAATGTTETPYFNPITGVYTPIKDVTYSPQRERVEMVTEFLVGEGVVLSWKQSTNRSVGYD